MAISPSRVAAQPSPFHADTCGQGRRSPCIIADIARAFLLLPLLSRAFGTIDNIDPKLVRLGHYIFDLLRSQLSLRQRAVQLVMRDIATLLA